MTPGSVRIRNLDFELTCSAFPEQYDVFLGEHQVGYVRLRFGKLSASCPDFRGQVVFHHSFPAELLGEFPTPEIRERLLDEIAEKIEEWWMGGGKVLC